MDARTTELESALAAGRRGRDSVPSLVTGALFFRWVWLVWMSVLAYVGRDGLVRPALAWASVALAAAWTIWLTVVRPRWTWRIRLADLVLCGWLVAASGLVVANGEVVSGRPFFATGYPLSAALSWGATRGPALGLAAGSLLAFVHLMSRPINGVPLDDLTVAQVQNVTGAMLNYLVAGLAVGVVWKMLTRSTAAVRSATTELVEERERSARLAERESLARELHDSVLQALTLVHKRGRELSSRPDVASRDVAELADLAAKQEGELRALILRPPATAPTGRASMRDELEAAARDVDGVDVTVNAVGALWLDQERAREVSAAVRQALENVARHASTSRATVFADSDDGELIVSVRDDGTGFVYDEDDLVRRGKVGILKSMKGRIEDLGGHMTVIAAPGRGTEVEFRVPIAEEGAE